MINSHLKRLVLWSTLCTLVLLFGTEQYATALTRTTCFDLVIKDDVRSFCPQSGTGVSRPCRADTWSTDYDRWVGMQVELWDRDGANAADDEFIGAWISQNGINCITFEWENASYSMGESNPDVYIKTVNRLHRSTSTVLPDTPQVWVFNSTGNLYPHITWRDFAFENCVFADATSCRLDQDGVAGAPFVPLHAFNSTATPHAKALLHADTAQRALQVFGSILDGHAYMRYPATDCSAGTAGCFTRGNIMHFSIGDVSPMDGTAAAHEYGHWMVAWAGRKAGSTRIGGTPDCSNGGGGYTKTSIEWQSCAVSEGWAEYVFATSFWSPSNTGSWPVVGDSSVGLFEFEPATPSTATLSPVQPLANNAWMIGQAARAFWDLDDSANEAGVSNCGSTNDNDVSNLASTSLMFIWQQFQSGTTNRKIDEWDVANGGNQNGTNLWDFIANMPSPDQAGATQTMMYHNCTETQAN